MSNTNHSNQRSFYGGKSPRDVPFFRIKEAARAIDGMPESTLRTWCNHKIFRPANCERPITLSFNNLVEARVLRALRVRHEMRMDIIKEAIDYAENKLGVSQLLLRRDLQFDGLSLVIKHMGESVSLTPSHQLKLRALLDQSLQRVEWDRDNFARRVYPHFSGGDNSNVVYLDPEISFGRTVVSERAISTNVIYNRFNAGESEQFIAEDYRISADDVRQAILFEAA